MALWRSEPLAKLHTSARTEHVSSHRSIKTQMIIVYASKHDMHMFLESDLYRKYEIYGQKIDRGSDDHLRMVSKVVHVQLT